MFTHPWLHEKVSILRVVKYIASRSRCLRKMAGPSVVYFATGVKFCWRRRPIAQNRAINDRITRYFVDCSGVGNHLNVSLSSCM